MIIVHYGISNSAAGLLTSVFFLVHIPLSIPAGLLVGRIGLKTLITLGALAGSTPLLSFLTTDSFTLLLATRAFLSLGFMLLVPATGPLFMQWFRSKELPLVNGSMVVAASLGIAISNFLVAPLSNTFGWEVVLSGFGALTLLTAIAWMFFGKSYRVPTGEGSSSLVKRLWEVLPSRFTLLIAAADAGPLGLLTVSVAWLPTLYHQVHGISLTETGILMGLLSLAGSIAFVLASLLTATTPRRRPFLLVPGILIGFAGFATILLGNSIALYIAVAVLGFTSWFYIPALLTLPMERYPNDPRGLIYHTRCGDMMCASFFSLYGVRNARCHRPNVPSRIQGGDGFHQRKVNSSPPLSNLRGQQLVSSERSCCRRELHGRHRSVCRYRSSTRISGLQHLRIYDALPRQYVRTLCSCRSGQWLRNQRGTRRLAWSDAPIGQRRLSLKGYSGRSV